MKNPLDAISATTNKVWKQNSTRIAKKFGQYRYILTVNGNGEVELYDFKKMTIVAKGNRNVQTAIKNLAA